MTEQRRDDQGYAAILTAVVVAFLFLPLSAIGVDVSRWYLEIARLQNAADAAALAGVTYMPDNLAGATTAAVTSATDNGFAPSSTVNVNVSIGARSSQLRVTITSVVTNAFGSGFGAKTSPMTATAVADFSGPAPMGSPCNTFGNEPAGTTLLSPVLSALMAPSGASCTSNPQFWANVHGPNVYKTQGDQYSSRYCQNGTSPEDGCTGSANNEFDPLGYFYAIHISAAAVNVPVTVQLYDPAYVPTGVTCSQPSGVTGNSWNPFATLDAIARYATGSSLFCSGDSANTGTQLGSDTPTVTSFGLRAPVDTLVPKTAPAVAGCAKQFPGYSQVTANQLRSTDAAYLPKLAAVFHQWVPLCTFTPSRTGDYYLQVRTNVALAGTAQADGSYVGSTAVYTQTGDDATVTGNGSNRFAIRAVSTAGASVAISGWEHMSVYANASGATSTFNLVRVIPAAVGRTLDFEFFDAGDAASNGTLQLLQPSETTSTMGTCTGSGVKNGTLTGCTITGISKDAGWNGKSQHIRVQIPPGYTCSDTSAGGCWWRVKIGFGTGSSVTDVTTWSANVEGDPVRLIE